MIKTQNQGKSIHISQSKTQTNMLTKKIGGTIYNVFFHFSDTSKENINDIILRLIRNDVVNC